MGTVLGAKNLSMELTFLLRKQTISKKDTKSFQMFEDDGVK